MVAYQVMFKAHDGWRPVRDLGGGELPPMTRDEAWDLLCKLKKWNLGLFYMTGDAE